MTQLRKKMLEELERRNYAHRTAKTYIRIVHDFAEHFHQPPDKLGPEKIRQYRAFLFQSKKLSPASCRWIQWEVSRPRRFRSRLATNRSETNVRSKVNSVCSRGSKR
jgi:Phage integrase, N-terminal SAM-like domain